MNNNMNFDGYGYPDMNLLGNLFMAGNNQNNNQMDIKQNKALAEPYEAFIRGNLYNNLYQQYKNYRPAKLIPNNEQAELLLNVDQLTFATHELNLYLDIYPDNQMMIKLFNHYTKMANEAIERYEKKYGPLTVNAQSNLDAFSWQAYSWPWEMEEM